MTWKSLQIPYLVLQVLSLSNGHPHYENPKMHETDMPKLIVVSFDGFRWDYLNIVKNQGLQTPNFDIMVREGATVEGGLKNVFITKTLPNHYSIVTGRYEEEHGIVGNNFFDPLFNESFNIAANDSSDAKWWDGKTGVYVDPIWKVNERCGCKEKCKCKRKSGAIFWPGSRAKTLQPTYSLKYNVSMSFKQRVDTLVEWFMYEEYPINFGLLYFHEPDATGHKFGPLSSEVALMVTQLDNVLGYLMASLRQHKLFSSTNLIITSDHGMLSLQNTIYLSDHVDTTLFNIYSTSPVFHIFPLPGELDRLYKAFQQVDNIDVYLKKNIPAEYHYRDNRRIPPILLVAHPHYSMCVSKDVCFSNKGGHGYNNSVSSMHPIFIARGPSFKPQWRQRSVVESVDLFPLMAILLNLSPPASSGLLSRVQALLINPPPSHENIVFISVAFLIVAVALVFSVCACLQHLRYFSSLKTPSVVAMETEGNATYKLHDSHQHLLMSAEDEDDEIL